MESIKINVGVYTSLTVDLSNLDFTGVEKVVLTIKNDPSTDLEPIIKQEFTSPRKYSIPILPEESAKLRAGSVYELNKVMDGVIHPVSEKCTVVLRRSIGDCLDSIISIQNEFIGGTATHNLSIDDQLATIAENQKAVYDAGKGGGGGSDSYYDAFWDDYQVNGNRTNYAEAFRDEGWTEAIFKPKYDIILGSGETNKNMFNGSSINADLVEICEKQGITIDFAKCTRFEYTFYGSRFTRLGVIDAKNATITAGAFAYAGLLKTIDKLISAETTGFANSMFTSCKSLENITFDGVIAKNLFMQQSSKLTVASVQSIIDHLKDLTGQTSQKVSFHSDVIAKLTEAQFNAIAAKNWTI